MSAEREIKVQYFNGAGYVVREWRGSTGLRFASVGIRQGMRAPSGFAVRTYARGEVQS